MSVDIYVDIYMDVSYHLKSQARFAFAEQSFLAYPDPRMSRRASRPSSTFFLPIFSTGRECLELTQLPLV